MTTAPDSFSENELHAYVDGKLTPERRAEAEAFLANHPEAAAEVAAWQAQNKAIRAAFGAEPVLGARDRALVAGLSRGGRGHTRRFALAAGFALFFLAGGGAGALLTAALQQDAPVQIAQMLPEASKANYLIYAGERRHPVEVAASEEEHLVRWLGNRIGRTLHAPDLSEKGFSLVGGRLVPFAEKPGAMLMYENGSGDRVTVLIGVNSGHEGTSFRFNETDGVSTFYWADNGFGYAMSGAVGRETLLGLAHIVYAQY